MTAKLSGKAALVTGGSRGIGPAIAVKFADEGADVAITYVGNSGAADKTVAAIASRGRRGLAIKADAADARAAREASDRVAATFGGLDIVACSAGVADYVPITAVGADEYLAITRKHMSVNVEGIVATVAAALPHLRDKGRVILIGSVNAHQMPFPGVAVYGASKAAVAGLARGWARDLGSREILVNVIEPGPIDTEMNPADDREEVRAMTAMTALKRYGRVEEIAAVAAFLASEGASYITGTTIDVDGGFSI